MIYRLLLDGNEFYNPLDDRVLLNTNVSMELDSAGSCEFTIPPTHRYYNSVNLLTQTLEILDENNAVVWFGRPTEISVDFYNQKKVYFEGPFAFFGDTIQRPVERFNYSAIQFFEDLIANHNNQVSSTDRQFTVGNVTVSDRAVYRKTDYETTKECLEKMCVDAEGGYLMFRRVNGINYIDWVEYPQVNSNQVIQYAANLSDLTQNLNCDEVYTGVIPLGAEDEHGVRLTIASVNSGSDYLQNADAVNLYGEIFEVLDLSELDDASKLKTEGQLFLKKLWGDDGHFSDHVFDSIVIEVSAADLGYIDSDCNTFQLGQKVRVLSDPHGIDKTLPITKIGFSLDSGVKDVTIGTIPRKTLTEIYYEG